MHFWAEVQHYTFQYYGVDWLITLTAFTGIFLLGEKKKEGFILGMISSAVGIIFSFQIGSIANGITSLVLFFFYLRGYIKWRTTPE